MSKPLKPNYLCSSAHTESSHTSLSLSQAIWNNRDLSSVIHNMYKTTGSAQPLFVSASRKISAPRSEIFAVLTDPSKHPLLDGSTTVKGVISGNKLALGTKFSMSMRLWVPYHITNTVVEYEEDSLIAWRHFFGHRWRYELDQVDENTTLVTETFDYSTAKSPSGIKLMKFPEKNYLSIVKTLERLANLVEKKETS